MQPSVVRCNLSWLLVLQQQNPVIILKAYLARPSLQKKQASKKMIKLLFSIENKAGGWGRGGQNVTDSTLYSL